MKIFSRSQASAPGSPGTTEIGLDRLRPGKSAVLVRYEQNSELAERLMELGLTPGTSVQVIREAPFGDPLQIYFRGTDVGIRKADAAHLIVRTEETRE
jgi:Fe2+ transport system protein FeoA